MKTATKKGAAFTGDVIAIGAIAVRALIGFLLEASALEEKQILQTGYSAHY